MCVSVIYRRSQFQCITKHELCPPKQTAMSNYSFFLSNILDAKSPFKTDFWNIKSLYYIDNVTFFNHIGRKTSSHGYDGDFLVNSMCIAMPFFITIIINEPPYQIMIWNTSVALSHPNRRHSLWSFPCGLRAFRTLPSFYGMTPSLCVVLFRDDA